MEENVKYKFQRIEKKFRMTREQYEKLKPCLEEHMKTDRYGLVTVRNIFYDTPDFHLIRNSIERPLFKEKLRVRSYEKIKDGTEVFVEVKKKLNGIGYKSRIRVHFSDAKKIVTGEDILNNRDATYTEIINFARRYPLEPKAYLTYKRYAMYESGSDLRLTVDRDIRFDLTEPENARDELTQPVTGTEGIYILEVKSPSEMPLWLADRLCEFKIYQAPFSKIGTCYINNIQKINYDGRY